MREVRTAERLAPGAWISWSASSAIRQTQKMLAMSQLVVLLVLQCAAGTNGSYCWYYITANYNYQLQWIKELDKYKATSLAKSLTDALFKILPMASYIIIHYKAVIWSKVFQMVPITCKSIFVAVQKLYSPLQGFFQSSSTKLYSVIYS